MRLSSFFKKNQRNQETNHRENNFNLKCKKLMRYFEMKWKGAMAISHLKLGIFRELFDLLSKHQFSETKSVYYKRTCTDCRLILV